MAAKKKIFLIIFLFIILTFWLFYFLNRELFELFCKSLKDLPTMYDMNPGTIGNTQGERKLKTPAKKAIVRGISWVMLLL